MGYFKAESFDNVGDWNFTTIPGNFMRLTTTDFEHLQVNDSKTDTLVAYFDSAYPLVDTSISKTFESPIYYKFPDVYGKPLFYDTLRLTIRAELDRNLNQVYRKPVDFFISFGIMLEGSVVREWFLPVVDIGCGYDHIDLDLKPLLDETLTKQGFDTIFFHVLDHPLNSKIYFGEMYLVQESDPTHNVKLALADLMHLTRKEFLTTLNKTCRAGDKELEIQGTADVQKGTAVMLFDTETGYEEVHVIQSVDYTGDGKKRRAKITFINEFDGSSMLYQWPVNTKIYRVFPAIIEELKDSESIFPLYYFYNEAMITDEENQYTGAVIDSYVRDTVNGHKSAIRPGLNSVMMMVSVNVFSNVPEVAQEMWDLLKASINTQSVLDVAGRPYQYVVASERDVAPDDSEILPHYVMELTFYFQHNVFERKYRPFPVFNNIRAEFELLPVEVIK